MLLVVVVVVFCFVFVWEKLQYVIVLTLFAGIRADQAPSPWHVEEKCRAENYVI